MRWNKIKEEGMKAESEGYAQPSTPIFTWVKEAT